ncbi:MAG: DotH/IcmK family type IV secretion protein [Gammaproteobacteria bacterium]|nr:DotH/IcmK family type IV secretion protein [Gammaproteobacteria bacterium]
MSNTHRRFTILQFFCLYFLLACFQTCLAAPTSTTVTQTTTTETQSVQSVTPASTSFDNDVANLRHWIAKHPKALKKPVVIHAQQNTPSAPPKPVAMNQDPLLVIPSPMTYQQSQNAILNSIPSDTPSSSDADEAFNEMVQQSMPLTPKQVVRLKQLVDQSQRAAVVPATVPPRPVSTTLMINLAPGTTPPAIRLAQGYVTSLVFVDSGGAPWPIAAYDIGNPKMTNISWDGKGNVLLIQATAPYGDSDLVIRLVGLATPVTLELVSGQRVVDYRTDIHVAGFGPNSKDLPTGDMLPASANQALLNVLDGVAPSGSRRLMVRGGDCMAWLLGDKMFLRTRMTVLSPGWTGRMKSPDGMYAYQMQASASVLVSRYGEPVELKVEGF